MRILWIVAKVVVFALPSICMALDLPSDRVIQFLTNVHTGQRMDPQAWLLSNARTAEQFNAFGGLDAMVRQTSSLAHNYRGIRSIYVKSVSPVKEGFEITAEVKFFDDEKRKTSPAAAEREDMVWKFRVEREEGIWKLAF